MKTRCEWQAKTEESIIPPPTLHLPHGLLKGRFTQKWILSHHLFSLILFQTYMALFPVWNTKYFRIFFLLILYFLYNLNWMDIMYSQVLKTSSLDIVLNIICCVPHKKESHPFNIITLSLSVQLQLQGPLGFRSTSRLQPIILCPWPARSLSAKPLCRDFLPGSLIVTQIHPVVFFFFYCIYFSVEAVRELCLIGRSENPGIRWMAAVPEKAVK